MPRQIFIDARPAYEWLSMANEESVADVIFVLGAGSMGPVTKALGEFRNGTARNICFTSSGGAFGGNLVFGTDETSTYSEYLLRHGVPRDCLHYPDQWSRTTNTLEEASSAFPFLHSRLNRLESMILCSRPVHQRRAWATFRKQYPGVRYINRPCEEMLTVEHLPRILSEVERIKKYGLRGDLEEQEIPSYVAQTCDQLQKLLSN